MGNDRLSDQTLTPGFNKNADLLGPRFNGDLTQTFKFQAANDPIFEGLSAQATIAARAGVGELVNGGPTHSIGNSPGLTVAALQGIQLNIAPLPQSTGPVVKPNTPDM